MSLNEATDSLNNYLIEHRTQVVNRLGDGNNITPFYSFLGENAQEEELEKMFNGFRTCACCRPHQGSVPIAYNSDETTPKIYGQKCDCQCRHNRRMLNRAFKYQVWLNEHTY